MIQFDVAKNILLEGISFRIPRIKKRLIDMPYDANKIITVIGSRRSGETYALFSLIKVLRKKVPKRNIIYLNLEDERLLPATVNELVMFLEAYKELFPKVEISKTYWFFDEVQNIPMWEKFIARLYRYTKHIFITGSNSQLLSVDIATALRGRTLTYKMYPLSFREFLYFNNFIDSLNKVNLDDIFLNVDKMHLLYNLMDKYIRFGAFPEVVLQKKHKIKIKLLQDYFASIFYKDLVERYELTNTYVLRFFIKRFIENIGEPFSVNKVYNQVKSAGYKVSKDTLYEYLDMIESVFLAFSVKKYAKSELKLHFMPSKIYAIDWGLAKAVMPITKSNIGATIENIIALNLLVGNKSSFYYSNGFECDFIYGEANLLGMSRLKGAVQVVYKVKSTKTLLREINGLIKTMQLINVPYGYLVLCRKTDNNMHMLQKYISGLSYSKDRLKIVSLPEFLLL